MCMIGQPRAAALKLVGTVLFIAGVMFISDLYTMRQEIEQYYDKFQTSKRDLREKVEVECREVQSSDSNSTKKKEARRNIKGYLHMSTSPRPPPPGKPACIDLMEGKAGMKAKAKSFMNFYPPSQIQNAEQLLVDLQDCDKFVQERGYPEDARSEEERDFPIAYSLLIHTDIWQAERLLRNIYQPQNHYCVHVDAKAHPKISSVIKGISRCLPNVFLVSKQESIVYASFSRLKAEINCLADLVFGSPLKKWKYFINLTGQAFPLKTNLELVKILKIYNGANDIEGLPAQRARSKYISQRWKFKWANVHGKLVLTDVPKEPPPKEITIIKGSAYGVFSREFVEYVLTDKLAKEFLQWSNDTFSPDEFYWSTLHHVFINPMFHSPGGFRGAPERKPWLASYSAWHIVDECQGRFVRSVCIFGVGDLPNLLSRKELFANKFYWDYQYLVLDCLEEWLRNKTSHVQPLDIKYYKELPFIESSVPHRASVVPGPIVKPTTPVSRLVH